MTESNWQPPEELVRAMGVGYLENPSNNAYEKLIAMLRAAHAANWRFVPAEPTREICYAIQMTLEGTGFASIAPAMQIWRAAILASERSG